MKGLTEEEVYKLMEDFSLIAASCLIAGISPTKCYYDDQYDSWGLNNLTNKDPDNAYEAFSIALSSLSNAVKIGKLTAFVVVNVNTSYVTKQNIDGEWLLTHEINPEKTIVSKEDLILWLKQRGVFPKIFFPQGKIADLSNTGHPLYSSKLHAIVDAWESLFTADIPSTTVKRYLSDWIESNAGNYKLGISSKAKFDELAEIANFDKRGVTVTGNPLYHFGGEAYKHTVEDKKAAINNKILANLPTEIDPIEDGELPF